MLRPLALLLPALVPSWRFFDVITASPRIEFRTAVDAPDQWHEFHPRPQKVSAAETFKRLFWNPRWNESLFLTSCAERLLDEPTDHSVQEIFVRIQRDLKADGLLQFRIVLLSRDDREIAYTSPVWTL